MHDEINTVLLQITTDRPAWKNYLNAQNPGDVITALATMRCKREALYRHAICACARRAVTILHVMHQSPLLSQLNVLEGKIFVPTNVGVAYKTIQNRIRDEARARQNLEIRFPDDGGWSPVIQRWPDMHTHAAYFACIGATVVKLEPTIRASLWWAATAKTASIVVLPGSPAVSEEFMEEQRIQAEILRDIYGWFAEPPRQSAYTINDTVRIMAETIYDELQFSDMPILADAMEDAGCTNERILTHLRGNEIHVRGCWVLRAILNKTMFKPK